MERFIFDVTEQQSINQTLWQELQTNAGNKNILNELYRVQGQELQKLFNNRSSASDQAKDILGVTLTTVERAMIVLSAKILSSPSTNVQQADSIIASAKLLSNSVLPSLPQHDFVSGRLKISRRGHDEYLSLTGAQTSIAAGNPALMIFQYVRPLFWEVPRLVRGKELIDGKGETVAESFEWMINKYNMLCNKGNFNPYSDFAKTVALSYAVEIGVVMVSARMENLMRKIRRKLDGQTSIIAGREEDFFKREFAIEIDAIKADLVYVNEARATRSRVIEDEAERQLVIDFSFIWHHRLIEDEEFWQLAKPIIADYRQGRRSEAFVKREFLRKYFGRLFPRWRTRDFEEEGIAHYFSPADIARVQSTSGKTVVSQNDIPQEYQTIFPALVEKGDRQWREARVSEIIQASPNLSLAILKNFSRETQYRVNLKPLISDRFPGFHGYFLIGLDSLTLYEVLILDAMGQLSRDERLAMQVFLYREYCNSMDKTTIRQSWDNIVNIIQGYENPHPPFSFGPDFRYGEVTRISLEKSRNPANRQICNFSGKDGKYVWDVLQELMLYQFQRSGPDKPGYLQSLGISDNEIVDMLFNAYDEFSKPPNPGSNLKLSEYLLSMFASRFDTLLHADSIHESEQVLRAIIGEVIKREDKAAMQESTVAA